MPSMSVIPGRWFWKFGWICLGKWSQSKVSCIRKSLSSSVTRTLKPLNTCRTLEVMSRCGHQTPDTLTVNVRAPFLVSLVWLFKLSAGWTHGLELNVFLFPSKIQRSISISTTCTVKGLEWQILSSFLLLSKIQTILKKFVGFHGL